MSAVPKDRLPVGAGGLDTASWDEERLLSAGGAVGGTYPRGIPGAGKSQSPPWVIPGPQIQSEGPCIRTGERGASGERANAPRAPHFLCLHLRLPHPQPLPVSSSPSHTAPASSRW